MNRNFLPLALLLAANIHAAEYFASPRGSDTAAGTSEAAPFATIGKGVSMVKAGDTLTILPGEYREAVEVKKLAGTKDAPITIRAQREGSVLLRGDVEVTGWEAVKGLDGVFAANFGKTAQGVADPRTLTHYEPAATAAEIGTKPGAFFQDAKSNRLLVRTLDARPPGVVMVSITNGNGLALENCAHVVIEGVAFTGYQHLDNSVQFGSRTRWGVLAGKCDSITLRRCVAYLNSGGLCFTTGTANSLIEECFIFGNASRTIGISNQILGWGAKDCVFRRNRIEGFNSPTGSQDQITFYSNGGHSNLLENNIAIRASFMDKGEADNVRVTGNLTTGPKPDFYRPEDASNLRVTYKVTEKVAAQFADPVNGDFRLLPESPQRGKGLSGADPGPHPFREEVFFVSPSGDDSAPGLSPTKPWKTLKFAATRAKAGDTIYLLAGVYEEALVPAQSGTAEKPIRFARRGDGRVILDGKGKLPVGIDLSGRSHITVEGLVVRNFAQQGVKAEGGAGITLSDLLIGGTGSDGVSAKGVKALTLKHCFLGRSGGAGVRLAQCADATLLGNSFAAKLVCDVPTLAALWSDRNHFTPATANTPLIESAGIAHTTLAAWQKASALDTHSLSGDAAFDETDSGGGGLALRDDSPLIGRGPLATAIGPFRRLSAEQPVAVEQPRLHSSTPTTANLECRTPSAPVEITLEWGDSPALGQKRTAVAGIAHTVSLTGLKPGGTYHARFTTGVRETRTVFATDRETLQAPGDAAAQAETITFTTPAKAASARSLNVAPDGDDRRDGLTRATAWRTINHAASHAVAGDTVLVHTGTYEETVTVRGTGSADAPLTFRTAPGAVVWLTGSDRLRSTAFLIKEKSHVVLDGFRFRDFLSEESSHKAVVVIIGGSHNAVRRCFYDGRVLSGYMNVFLGMSDSPDALVENCVMILGMGEGMSLNTCPRSVVRHCVFYNNNIRALSVMTDITGAQHDPVTVTHNLFCAVIPAKGGSAFMRTRQLRNLVSDHNAYFDRIAESERSIVETMFIGEKKVGQPKPGSYDGMDFTLVTIRTEMGNEKHSLFGNPGIAVVKELSPRYDKVTPDSNERTWQGKWMANELHQTRQEIQPLDFHHFIAAPDSPLAKAADGKPIGLDPAVFGAVFAQAVDRGAPAVNHPSPK
jgi:hypothetical protein